MEWNGVYETGRSLINQFILTCIIFYLSLDLLN